MRVLDNDLISLIRLLVKRPFKTLPDVCVESNATKRQIMYRLDKINDLLKYESLPLIQLGSRKEFTINPKSKNFLIHFLFDLNDNIVYYFNKAERLAYMYIMLFIHMDYLSMQHFTDLLKVSKSTALQDLKELSQILLKENIQLRNNRHRGYYLMGDEIAIRRYMMRIVIDYVADERNTKVFDEFIRDFKLGNYEEYKTAIKDISKKYNISFVEDRLQEFIYIFIFLKSRIIEGSITLNETLYLHTDLMKTFKEYAFSNDLINHYNYDMNELEIKYLSAWVLGISVGDVKEESQDRTLIGEIVDKIMSRFEFLSGMYCPNHDEFFTQLYSHFRPAYYRMLFNLPIYNPFKEKIKEEYGELFQLLKEAVKSFSMIFEGDIFDDELAYLTIHFAAIYARNQESEIVKKKNALIICSNGIGSSAILYHELKNIFPEIYFLSPIEAARFEPETNAIDIIFTTHYFKALNNTNIPVVKVNPIMDAKERYEIERQVYAYLGLSLYDQPSIDSIVKILKKHTDNIYDEQMLKYDLLDIFSTHQQEIKPAKKKTYHLIDMVSKETIILGLEAKDWIEGVEKSGKPLVETGKIEQRYIDTIIQSPRTTISYTVIVPHVALTHSLPEMGAKQCAMGICSLKTPVEFGNKENDPVKYIFFLSAVDNEAHLPAMSDLLNLLNNPKFFEMIDNAEDASEVVAYIEHNCKENKG